jgi:hypothetical protein
MFLAVRWVLAAFPVCWSYTQSKGLLGRAICKLQDFYLHTQQHNHKIKVCNTDIHASSGIRIHDLSVPASEDCSCLIPRDHCARHSGIFPVFVYIIAIMDICACSIYWQTKASNQKPYHKLSEPLECVKLYIPTRPSTPSLLGAI